MTDFETPSTEPSYIASLALQSAPFSANVDPKSYYNGTQLDHRLNLLLHLVRSSDKVAIIVAADGLGKTTLLTQLQHRVGGEVRICRLDGQTQLNNDATLALCCRELGVDEAEIQNGNLADTFRNRLKQLRKLTIRPLLLVDNAQGLSAESLTALSNWLDWQDNDDYILQAVIASNSYINLAPSSQPRIQMVDLPAMDKQELSGYLMHRLTSVGYQGDNPFLDKDIQQFYRLSFGKPALINQLAHQQLLGLKPAVTTPEPSGSSSPRHGMRWLGIAILIVSFVLLLRYQDDVNQWLGPLSSKDIELTEQDVIDLEQVEEIAIVVVEDNDIKDNEQAQRDELASLLSEIPDAEETEPVEEQSETREIEQLEPDIVVEDNNSTPDIYQRDWVLQHQGAHYTFQLMGSWEKQEVHDFIDKYALTGDVAMFESMRNGRIWYALIYGAFENKQAALAASSNWPAPLNTLPSWLRRFDSVQKQIETFTLTDDE